MKIKIIQVALRVRMVLLDATAATHAPAAAAIAASPPAAAVGMPLVLEQLCLSFFSFFRCITD
jgi:hypothetical protein